MMSDLNDNIEAKKVANEFNTGLLFIEQLLRSKGYQVNIHPSFLLTVEQYEYIQSCFYNARKKGLEKPELFQEAISDNSWKIGRVKKFFTNKGYGFIDCFDDYEDYFVHISDTNKEVLEINDYVVFKLKPSKKGLKSYDVQLVSQFNEDMNFLMKKFTSYNILSLRKEILKVISSDKIKNLLNQQLNTFGTIKNEENYSRFEELIALFYNSTNSQELKSQFASIIENFIYNHVDDKKFIINFWLSNYIVNTPELQLVADYFKKSDQEQRLRIFKKVSYAERKELINRVLKTEDSKTILDLIIQYLKDSNNLSTNEIKVNLHDKEFWLDKHGYDLFENTIGLLQKTLDDKRKLLLFLSDYINRCPKDYVLSNYEDLTREQLVKLFEKQTFSESEAIELVLRIIEDRLEIVSAPKKSLGNDLGTYIFDYELDNNELEPFYWILNTLNKTFSVKSFEKIENNLVTRIPVWLHAILWHYGYLRTYPEEYLIDYFLNSSNFKKNIDNWLLNQQITKNKIINILKENLQKIQDIKTRHNFYILYCHILSLHDLEVEMQVVLNRLNNKIFWFYKLITWLEGIENDFNFDAFKTKLVFLTPNQQVDFLKKLFWLAHTGRFTLTIDKLDELTRIDFNLYKLNEECNDDIPLDISVDIVIEAIKSFQKRETFLFDNELLEIVLKDLSQNKKHKFQIKEFFEKCRGRSIPRFNFKTDNIIRKVGNKWEISFFYDDDLVQEVKKLSERRYNPNNKCWYVPDSFRNEVYAFAKQFGFYIEKDQNKFQNNTHLAHFERSEIPKGIKFCEGRKAYKRDNTFNLPFWWCCNRPCFQNCEADHTDPNYQRESKSGIKTSIDDLKY